MLKRGLMKSLIIAAVAKVMTCLLEGMARLLAGAVLTEVPKRIFPRFSDPQLYKRIPPIILTSEELRSIRITQDPGDPCTPLLCEYTGAVGNQSSTSGT